MRPWFALAVVALAVIVAAWVLWPQGRQSVIPVSSSLGPAPSAVEEGGEAVQSQFVPTAKDAPAVKKKAEQRVGPPKGEPKKIARQAPPHQMRAIVLRSAGPPTGRIGEKTTRSSTDLTRLLTGETSLSTVLASEEAVSQKVSSPRPDEIARIEGSALKPPGPPVSLAASEPPRREPVLTPPQVLSQTPPEYPSGGYRVALNRTSLTPQIVEAAEGRVILRLLVLADGSVDHVEVVVSSGHEVLDQTAVAAAKTWRFAPATRDGQPIEAWVVVPVHFVVP